METRDQSEAVVLSGLTRLMAQWSALALQARFVPDVGVTLDPVDIQPLYALGLSGQRRASELATELRVSRPTISKQLARLHAAGLITRHPDPTDGRAMIIALSDSGADVYAALVDSGLQMVRHIMADWSRDERRRLAELVQRFVATASAITHPADIPAPSRGPRDIPPSGGDPVAIPPTIANPATVHE
ncbi:MarR family winged helix-turn-helix transcriptional regulator [Microbacterium sp. zg.B48]|uniref:MarR family winged helix-turn-helix transcriptional regulator n=1 Tax=Microbacterium sp. zg.B48 TaxID=2969408 RepID=UPI00214C5D2E|nr:MarR family winged helix-turn-helix transcriptional regulator [Microbacterium sp. zg.B48]MCR2764971.1 MarR family winged helix-turn-helix transcriptional regulator [Microbacterium sp. zg.B48]